MFEFSKERMAEVMKFVLGLAALVAVLMIVTHFGGEDYNPEFDKERQELTITFHGYDTVQELNKALRDEYGTVRDRDGMAAWYDGENECDVYYVRPKKVDDVLTKYLGHEIAHCIYGRYHTVK